MVTSRENQLDNMTVGEKKSWLNEYGHLTCYPRMDASIKSMAIWTSTTRIYSVTEEGNDMDNVVAQIFMNVTDKLYRMTTIIENRMA